MSRTLIDKKIGTVTIFAFDEGQGLSEHTAPFDAFVQIVDGEAEITISGKPLIGARGRDRHHARGRAALAQGGEAVQDASHDDTRVTARGARRGSIFTVETVGRTRA